MTIKALLSELHHELAATGKMAFDLQRKETLRKQKALFEYRKLQLIKDGKNSDTSLKELQSSIANQENEAAPEPDLSFVENIVKRGEEREKHHLSNIVAFIRNQRTYQELLERYNPGISMKQKDKVRKTARRVGLDIPE